MSLMGLGFGQSGHGYCHMCASNHCHHIMGNAQQMNNDLYHQMLRAGMAQQQSISISSAGSITTGTTITTDKSIVVGQLPEPKLNKKLLLLME